MCSSDLDAGEARRWWQQASDKGVAEASARLAGRDAPPPFGIVVSVPGTGEAHAVAPGAADRPLTLAEIAEMQQLLKLLAFDPGSTDGLVTPQTTDAIRAYEGIAGLPTDGHPSMALLASLRAVAGAKAPQ